MEIHPTPEAAILTFLLESMRGFTNLQYPTPEVVTEQVTLCVLQRMPSVERLVILQADTLIQILPPGRPMSATFREGE